MTIATAEQAIQEKMRLFGLNEETARFILAVESGEIPGDVQYVRDGNMVTGVSPVQPRQNRGEGVTPSQRPHRP